MSVGELRKIQLIELEILKEVKRICSENEIEYFLACGTALGALRHQGFIPWDDDIDIGMTRDNYDRFLEVAPSELSSDYFLQTKLTDKNSPYYFAKIRKNDTIFMEWSKRNLDMHHGVYIDIFPHDNLPNNNQERLTFQKKCKKLYKFYTIKTTPDRDIEPEKNAKWVLLAFVRRLLYLIAKLIPFSVVKKIVDKNFQKYNNESTDYLTCLTYGKTYTFRSEDLFPLKEIIFEGERFKIVNNLDNYLKEFYGDYMKLPPENERTGHLPYKFKV